MYLGVDGGGTKTAFVLLDREGKIVARHLEPTSYYFEIGLDGLREVLQRGVEEVLTKGEVAAGALSFAFFGIPGYGEDSALVAEIDAVPRSILGARNYRCGNDMICGWASGSGGGDGIHIVAGTGSIGYGERGESSGRVGGWSELFGDEGSAYWISRLALEAFTRMSDGRCAKTLLHGMLAERLDLDCDLDICSLIVNKWQGSRGKIASLSSVVAAAAEEADPVAVHIFESAARELALMVKVLKDRLGFEKNEPVVTTYSGGVFKSGKIILSPLGKALEEMSPDSVLKEPDYSPDVGAALYAAKLDHHRFPGGSLEKLKVARRQ